MIKLVCARLADRVEVSRKLKGKAITASEQIHYTAQTDSLREIFEDLETKIFTNIYGFWYWTMDKIMS